MGQLSDPTSTAPVGVGVAADVGVPAEAFPDFEPEWGNPEYVAGLSGAHAAMPQTTPGDTRSTIPDFVSPTLTAASSANNVTPTVESPSKSELPMATPSPAEPLSEFDAAHQSTPTGASPLHTPPEAFQRIPSRPAVDPTNLSAGRLTNESQAELSPIPDSNQSAAEQFTGWWEPMISETLRDGAQPSRVSIGQLVYSAMQHSSRVKVLSDSPLIRETAVIEADADFDWGIFLETKWNDINDPIGSTLTTGGPPRYQDEKLTYDYGFQRKNRAGGEFSVGQQYGWEQSNSIFFVPNQQGTGRLTLNYTQPLMRGSGLMYNTSTVVLAQMGTGAARDEFSQELQTYLQEVTEAYWALYLERGSLLQRQRLYKRGEAILHQLEVRQGLDAIANQVVRAKSAVASRKSDLFRVAASVKNAEGQIRALVNSPDLGVLDQFELLPIDPPANQEVNISMHDAIEAAVRNRPELHQAMKEIHAASVRLNVSRNEMLPVLDFVINTYVSGLRGNSSIGNAYRDQFNTGSPSYSTGLRFEYPIGNRAARARNQRRVLELRQLQHQFRNTLHVLQLETETALRETTTTQLEVAAKHQAMKAAEGEVELLTDRWKILPGDDRSAALLLEDLLSAQERLTTQEFDFLRAQVNYSISLVNLKRATGTLLQFENISVNRSELDGVPELRLNKVAPVGYGAPVGAVRH